MHTATIGMIDILFICQGNMVRSQIAEALYTKYRGSGAASAGILPQAEHRAGKELSMLGMDDWVRTLEETEGIDISHNICKQVSEALVRNARRIVVMAQRELLPPFLAERSDIITWDGIRDTGGIANIHSTIGQIKKLVMAV